MAHNDGRVKSAASENQADKRGNASATTTGIYDVFRPILTATMLLGLTPLMNVRSSHSQTLSFCWCRLQSLYSMAVVLSMFFGTYLMATSYITMLAINDVVLGLTGPVFYIANTISMIHCIKVTRSLPELFRHWDVVGHKLRRYSDGGSVHASTRFILGLAVLMGISSVIEHVLHDMNLPIHLCPNYNGTYFQCYLTRGNPYFNDQFGHGPLLSVSFWVIQKYANFAWHFHDILIVILALALRHTFKVIVDYTKHHYKDINSEKQWKRLREHHLAVLDLAEHLDKVICFMTLQSYTVNMFYICVQVSLSLRPITRTTVQFAYFTYSLCHLLARTILVTVSASSVHEQAKAPLECLFDCPDDTYCTEVYRFTSHLMNIPMGLTGFKFFLITRQLFLILLSTLITYQLLLLRLS